MVDIITYCRDVTVVNEMIRWRRLRRVSITARHEIVCCIVVLRFAGRPLLFTYYGVNTLAGYYAIQQLP